MPTLSSTSQQEQSLRAVSLVVAGFFASGLLWPLGWVTTVWQVQFSAVLVLSIVSGICSLITLAHRYWSAPSLARFYAQTAFWIFMFFTIALWGYITFFMNIARTDIVDLELWSLYLPRTVFAFLILVTSIVLQEDERDVGIANCAYGGWVWIGTGFLFLIFGITALVLPIYSGWSFAFLYHTQELLPLSLFLVSLGFFIRRGLWRTYLFDYGLVWLCILQSMASLYLLFASVLGSSFGIAGIMFHIVALFVPCIAVECEMFRLYRSSEKHRQKVMVPHFGSKDAKTKLEADVFRQSVEQSHDALYITNAQGEVVFANRGFLDITGYQIRDVLGLTPDAWALKTEGQESYAAIMRKLKIRKELFKATWWHRREDGTPYEARVHISPIIDEFGEVVWFIVREHDLSVGRDRTLLLQQILDNMPLGICLVEAPSTNIILASEYAHTLFKKAGLKNLQKFGEMMDAFLTSSGDIYPSEKLPFIVTLNTKEAASADDLELQYVDETNAEGATITWRMQSTPLFDVQANLKHVLIAFEDITRQKNLEHKMTDAVSVASHQLRTPLTGIKWAIEELQKGEEFGSTKEEKIEMFSTLHDATVRMFNVVQGLLDVSKLEQGQIVIKPEPLKLDVLIDQILTEFAPQAKAKSITVKQSKLHTIPEAQFDAILVRQVIQNLIDNAIRYTKEGGEIDSILSMEHDHIQWALHDNGIGIEQEDLDHLFKKFHRGDNAQKLDAYGMGLGLYTVKFIIDLLDGEIRCDSEIGKGTTFRVQFPLKKKEGIKI